MSTLMRTLYRSVCLLLPGLLLVACSTLSISLPPVTEQPVSERQAGKIIWHDLLTTDIEGSRAFYEGLFGWEFEEVPLALGFGRSSSYLLIRHQGKLVGGMVDLTRLDARGNASQWVAIMSVADVDAAANQVVASGGEVLTPPTDLDERGRLAVVKDNAGALFGLLQTRAGDPPDVSAAYGSFMWDEVWVPDAAAAARFYQAVAPFEPVSVETSAGTRYQGLAVDGRPRMGILENPIPGLAPTWASYIRVADMSLLDRVEALGGVVWLPAEPRPLGGEVALIAGPSGAGIAIQTWPDEGA